MVNERYGHDDDQEVLEKRIRSQDRWMPPTFNPQCPMRDGKNGRELVAGAISNKGPTLDIRHPMRRIVSHGKRLWADIVPYQRRHLPCNTTPAKQMSTEHEV